MDPDVHDVRQQQHEQQRTNSPSAIEAIVAAAAAQSGKADEFNPSRSLLESSGLQEVLCISA
jgi:hypothetical protein